MKHYSHCCEDMAGAVSDSFSPIRFTERFRQFGINVLDGGSSYIKINYCPWCGAKLPPSLKERWFETLESLSIDPHSDNIPSPYLDGTWYENSNR